MVSAPAGEVQERGGHRSEMRGNDGRNTSAKVCNPDQRADIMRQTHVHTPAGGRARRSLPFRMGRSAATAFPAETYT
jgi:hypothetical protein